LFSYASVRAAAAVAEVPTPHRQESLVRGQSTLGAALAAWAEAAAAEAEEAAETTVARAAEQPSLACSRRVKQNVAEAADFCDEFAEDSYDPCDPKYILPATTQEILEFDVHLLHRQTLRLSQSILAREFMKEDPAILQGYKDTLESTRRLLASQLAML